MSIDLLVDQLAGAIGALEPEGDSRRDAEVIYQLSFSTLQQHLTRSTRPSAAETDHLARFCLRGIGV